jgi:hypothetical protein
VLGTFVFRMTLPAVGMAIQSIQSILRTLEALKPERMSSQTFSKVAVIAQPIPDSRETLTYTSALLHASIPDVAAIVKKYFS